MPVLDFDTRHFKKLTEVIVTVFRNQKQREMQACFLPKIMLWFKEIFS